MVVISIKGKAAQNILAKEAWGLTVNQSGSKKEKVIPLPLRQSRLHNSPALQYKTEDAPILENQVTG